MITYGSLCSGIEGASVAFRRFGWQPVYFAEVNPFCCRLLTCRYPKVPNYGDITTIRQTLQADLIVGGTPCQSFSVTGLRKGLDDDRGNLLRAFCRIITQIRPRWVIWENVPGVMSTEGGRGFGTLLGCLAECGYGLAWRVLDAIGFGVPQRRRRVFVIGYFGDWRKSFAVLFDSPTRDKGTQSSAKIRANKLSSNGFTEASCFGWTGDETPKFQIDATPTLRAEQGGEGVGILTKADWRKLMPVEWERLQGFPDGYTAIDGATDRDRTRALGNSFAVPVVRWLGQRIQEIENGCDDIHRRR